MLPKKQTSASVTLPSPVGGWNARDSIASMPVTDAWSLVNWFPATTECVLRSGYTKHATGLPGQVESLLDYEGGGTSELFAISEGEVYDVTNGGAVGAAVLTGLTNSRWQYTNVATAGGNFLYMANGVDTPYLYNGTTWTSITGASTPAITGVTTTNLNNPVVFKNRVFFIEKNSLKTWYLPTGAVGGAANPVDMSAIAQLGGYIVAHATWTIDAGQGVDDYYVAVTSKGEVIVFQGTDPSSASTWALKGVWVVGSPVGSRCMQRLGGDILLICQDGVLPLGAALQSSRVNPRVALTDKIQSAVSQAISIYGSNFGWEVLYFPRENQLWLNVPIGVGDQEQYAMNTINKSWGQYQGWEANCWRLFNDDPYFGGNGYVGLAWSTNADDGQGISAYALQAFSDLNYSANKRFTMIRPIFRATGVPAILGSINLDFNTDYSTAPLSFTPITTAIWDSATWDSGIWGGGLSILNNWQGVNGVGLYAAPQINLTTSGIEVRWASTQIVYERGAIL